MTIIEVSSGTSNTGKEMKLDDAAVETFRSMDGVQAVMPKMNCDYTVNLYAGLNNRYKAEWATLVGMDTSALEAMGYEFLDGITAGGGRDEGVAGQYLAYSFKDTLLPDGSNMVDRWGEHDDQGNQTKGPEDPYLSLIHICSGTAGSSLQPQKNGILMTIRPSDASPIWSTGACCRSA